MLHPAVVAAKGAFPSWSRLSNDERCAWLEKIADGIENRIDEFAAAESRDNGKPLHLAKTVDIPRAISNFRFLPVQSPSGLQNHIRWLMSASITP